MRYGKIMRGKTSVDFSRLASEQDRELAMVMGDDGLQKIVGLEDRDLLRAIGYKDIYIDRLIGEGNVFKIATFEVPITASPRFANWPGVAVEVSAVYPKTLDAWLRHIETLEKRPFAEWQRTAGYSFATVDKNGRSDPHFMTHDRFLASHQTALDLRAFLYFTVRLTDLFTGNGFTVNEQGERQVAEYIMPNLPLNQLRKLVLTDIEIL